LHSGAIETLRDTPHIYTSCFQVLSLCGLGEVELAAGNGTAALAHYRRARRLITESRRIIGSVRLLLRVNSGLAASYAAAGEMPRAVELAHEVAAQLRDIPPPKPTATFECSLAQLWLSLAVAQTRIGEFDNAAASVVSACDLGWLDWRWLRADSAFGALQTHPVFASCVDRLASAPDAEFPTPSLTLPAVPESSAPAQATPARTPIRE
jgi:hypothetical protein